MVFVPAGEFVMGSEDKDTNSLAKEFGSRQKIFFMNEKPVNKVNLDAYYIDKFEVTNKEYRFFISKTDNPSSYWAKEEYNTERDTHPVFNVTWYDADAYCRWADKRLPAEEEWEKAARGPNGNRYPWGNDFNENKANLRKGDTVPVGSLLEDKSYYGAFDMGGNLMEWTSSWYKAYPGSKFKLKEYGEKFRVIRGGTGNVIGHYRLVNIYSRSSYRHYNLANGKTPDVGFRCVKD